MSKLQSPPSYVLNMRGEAGRELSGVVATESGLGSEWSQL